MLKQIFTFVNFVNANSFYAFRNQVFLWDYLGKFSGPAETDIEIKYLFANKSPSFIHNTSGFIC